MRQIISVEEARKLLGHDADRMTDVEIEELIATLDLLAKDALDMARRQIRMKNDANDLAELVYDVYQDKKRLDSGKGTDV